MTAKMVQTVQSVIDRMERMTIMTIVNGMDGMDGIKDIKKRATRKAVVAQPSSRRESSFVTSSEYESGSDDEKENVDYL